MFAGNYRQIKNFGPSTVSVNYYSAALDTTVNANYVMAKPQWLFDARTLNGQLLLSTHIAENSKSGSFDDVSIAAMNQMGKGYPNNVPNCQGLPVNQNLQYGDMLVDNAGRMKYCVYQNATPKQFPYNPDDPNSPMLTFMEGGNIRAVCSVDPATVDKDPLMDKLIRDADKHVGLLQNIYNNSTGLEGTKLGKFFKMNENYFSAPKPNCTNYGLGVGKGC